MEQPNSKCYALTLISNNACFTVMKDILLIVKSQICQIDELSRKNLGFLLSVFFNHIVINSSSLVLDIIIQNQLQQQIHVSIDNNLQSSKCNILDSMENFPFAQAVLSISSCDLVNSVLNLLQEKKVVLISKNIGDMALYISAILSLLKPFKWPSGVLSVLTSDLIDYLDAPFPFIAGIETKVWESIQKRRKGQLDEEITTAHLQNDFKLIMSTDWNVEMASKARGSKNC